MAYYELVGTRHYEYRYEDETDEMTGWQDAGPAGDGSEKDEWLAHLKQTLATATYWEIRVCVSVADDQGRFAGLLTLSDRMEGGSDLA